MTKTRRNFRRVEAKSCANCCHLNSRRGENWDYWFCNQEPKCEYVYDPDDDNVYRPRRFTCDEWIPISTMHKEKKREDQIV